MLKVLYLKYKYIIFVSIVTYNINMESILEISQSQILSAKTSFNRYLLEEIPKDQRLVFIKGARGSGKTTLLLQYLKKLNLPNDKAVYLSLDDIVFSNIEVIDFVDWFYKRGGEVLVLDEVHKYPEWSKTLKTIYDRYPNLKEIVTCSSALQLGKGDADLSRRAISMHLNELSLREFVELKYGISIPKYSLDDLLSNHEKIVPTITQKLKPLQVFDYYLKIGSYPFFLEGEEYYHKRLSNVVNLVLETDLSAIDNITFGTVIKLRKLLYVIAEVVPFTPNISELSAKIGITREQLYRLLFLLEKAEIIYLVRKSSKGMSMMAKPEKIFLHNPNLSEALTHSKTNSGTLRETFFLNQLSALHEVNYTEYGDFLVDNHITFEIGGKQKSKKQIKGIDKSYIVKDGIEYGSREIIPLWLFGFLY